MTDQMFSSLSPDHEKSSSVQTSIAHPGSHSNDGAPVVDIENGIHTTQRGLKSRHVQMIAIGGTIGTGLFVSSGRTLALGGPAFLLAAYAILSALIYLIVLSLTEMCTYLPLRGGTMSYYGSRYFSPSMGFMMGYLYTYSFAIFVPFELTASALVIEYWHPNVNSAVWITVFLVTIVILNLLPVKYYGEAEFWFAGLKVILIVGLIMLSIVLFFGGGPSGDRLYFGYWRHPGAAKELAYTGGTGRFVAFIATIVSCVLPFTFAPEMLVVTAGEAESPRRNLPKTARRFFWRLMIFYIGGVLAIGVICPADDPALTSGKAGAGSSPWVVGIKNAGISGLDSVVNSVIMTAAWSAGNAFLYLASRSLYSLAIAGDAPAIFAKCNKYGTPYVAVCTCSLFSLLAYLTINSTASQVFDWMLNLVNTGGLISWICCAMTFIRFRKACEVQGVVSSLPYYSRFQPIGSWITMVLFTILCLLNGFTVFLPGSWSISDFLSAYIGIPIFIGIYFIHRFVHRNDNWMIPVEEVDLITGLEEVEAEEKPEKIQTTWWGKASSYVF
jgi:yeast amino acid transporter